MQLTKGSPFEDNSLFAEHMLLHEMPSPQHPFPHNPKPSLQEDSHQHPDANPSLPLLASNQLRFYQEFKKIYTVSHHLALEKRRQLGLLEGLVRRVRGLQDRMRDVREKETVRQDQNSDENRAKRSRRTAEEIQKKFKCQVTYCERLYGSQGSLQQHIKLKHPQLYLRSHSEDSLMLNNHDDSI